MSDAHPNGDHNGLSLPANPHPAKRQRTGSVSTTSSVEPTAQFLPNPNSINHAGKKTTSSMKAKPSAENAPTTTEELQLMNDATRSSDVQTAVNGHNDDGPIVKLEDQLNDVQLDSLAVGLPIDGSSNTNKFSSIRQEKPAMAELKSGTIQVTAVKNDSHPRSTVILSGLKTLFQKQLPNMPREYIARLVFDVNSRGLAIIKRGLKVVGGICFRPFPHRGFAEIVFLAATSVDQAKGYGALLMDHFKTHIKETYGPDNPAGEIVHFLTYADNYAVGYFKKQGFTKEISLDRSVWAGYIKDYEGGTIMLCTLVPRVNYLEKANILQTQKNAVLDKIRSKSKTHQVYKGICSFETKENGDIRIDPSNVPGLKETGWTLAMANSLAKGPPKNAEHALMERLLGDLNNHNAAWPFKVPVDGSIVPDYYNVIKKPMDFQTMDHKLNTNQYKDLKTFLDDAQLVFDNCRTYNPAESVYARKATKLEKFLRARVDEQMKQGDS